MSISNWATLHAVDLSLLQDVLLSLRAGALPTSPFPSSAAQNKCPPCDPLPRLETALKEVVAPAFAAAFGAPDRIQNMLAAIRFAPLAQSGARIPHVIDPGDTEPPLVVMDWHGAPADLMCLAHEAAHAVQVMLSDHAPMPPIARETCAFLGELILTEHVRHRDPALFAALVAVWEDENAAYLGTDLDALSEALNDPAAAYHYRQNYPIARLAAVSLFCEGRDGDVRDLFASGDDAMSLLLIATMAEGASRLVNGLPAMPVADPDEPVVDAYRRLGAMALLDIDHGQGACIHRIKDYYTSMLTHLAEGTVFVALNAARKPLGYASWQHGPGTERVTLTRQAAPFGDHIALQHAIERHLDQGMRVGARHERSARPEQVAW